VSDLMQKMQGLSFREADVVCGCRYNWHSRARTYCQMHDPETPWGKILNCSTHTFQVGKEEDQTLELVRFIGGYTEWQMHELYWAMGGWKPPFLEKAIGP
jgi:hypothetical protein